MTVRKKNVEKVIFLAQIFAYIKKNQYLCSGFANYN